MTTPQPLHPDKTAALTGESARPQPNTVRSPKIPKSTLPVATTVNQTNKKSTPPPPRDDRRDFFNEAMRETLGPLAGIIERKINPILAALEAIPEEAERLANTPLPGILDQPQTRQQKSLPLPVVPEPSPDEPYLRPPGADPGTFETLCSRCRKCVEACPAQAILMDPYQHLGEGLPYLVPHSQACVVCTDLACMPACPTGALRVLDRLSIKMGTAKVDHDLCLRSHGENCTLCVDVCPITKEGAHPEKGDAIVIHAESGRVRIRKNVCIGCGLCENRCPTQPQAIRVVPARGRPDPIIA